MSGGPDEPGEAERRERNAARWRDVRKGGRLGFHALLTVLTVVVWVGGEVLGKLIFRRADLRFGDLGDDVVVAVLLGNLIAWLLWRGQDARTPD